MKTRLFKNWITTFIGLFILAFASWLTYKERLPFEAFMAALPTVLILFRAKDSLLWGKAKE